MCVSLLVVLVLSFVVCILGFQLYFSMFPPLAGLVEEYLLFERKSRTTTFCFYFWSFDPPAGGLRTSFWLIAMYIYIIKIPFL